MKNKTFALLSIAATALLAGCSQSPISSKGETIEFDKLVERNDKLYKGQNTLTPFSGTVVGHHDNGRLHRKGTFKDGKAEGKTIAYHENGQKSAEATFKDGKPDGISTVWHNNGQKWKEGPMKDGLMDGIWTVWSEDGKRIGEATFKDGELIKEEKFD